MRANIKDQTLSPGDVITIAGQDYFYDGKTEKLRNIRNLQDSISISELEQAAERSAEPGWSI